LGRGRKKKIFVSESQKKEGGGKRWTRPISTKEGGASSQKSEGKDSLWHEIKKTSFEDERLGNLKIIELNLPGVRATTKQAGGERGSGSPLTMTKTPKGKHQKLSKVSPCKNGRTEKKNLANPRIHRN